MSVINRSAVIIRPLPPYLAWAKQDDTTNIAERVFEDLRTAPHVYLLPEYEDAESEREVLEDFWPELFAAMLNGWLTDEQQWPKNRTHQMFSGSTSRCVRWSRICIWMKSWSNSTRAGHAAIPDSRRPDIRIGRGRWRRGERTRLIYASWFSSKTTTSLNPYRRLYVLFTLHSEI